MTVFFSFSSEAPCKASGEGSDSLYDAHVPSARVSQSSAGARPIAAAEEAQSLILPQTPLTPLHSVMVTAGDPTDTMAAQLREAQTIVAGARP